MVEPKVPQDRKPKAVPKEPEHPVGWDLLKPFSEVPVWDQAELMEIIKPLTATAEDEGSDEERALSFDTRVVGQLAKWLLEYATVDGVALTKVFSGRGALERAIRLGVAYAEELGESEPSTTG